MTNDDKLTLGVLRDAVERYENTPEMSDGLYYVVLDPYAYTFFLLMVGCEYAAGWILKIQAVKSKFPAPYEQYFNTLKRRADNIKRLARKSGGPHWTWRGHPVATAKERERAKYRRAFETYKYNMRREHGEYWDWDMSADEMWAEFKLTHGGL